jgi:hypothetical protein
LYIYFYLLSDEESKVRGCVDICRDSDGCNGSPKKLVTNKMVEISSILMVFVLSLNDNYTWNWILAYDNKILLITFALLHFLTNNDVVD